MKKRILCIILASVFLLPLLAGIPASAAGSDKPIYSISFDYELDTTANAQMTLLFNQRTNNNANDYLRWIFTNAGLQTGKRGSYRQLISTTYRWNNINSVTFADGLATPGSMVSAQIDVFQSYIETYINGVLVDTTTFAQINAADTLNGTFAPNPTSQVGLNSMAAHGTNYMDNLLGINYASGSPVFLFFANFESVNPFSGGGTALVDGRLQIANISSNDTSHRWINLSQATADVDTVLNFLYNQYIGLDPNDHKSWSWPQFEAALNEVGLVVNDPLASEGDKQNALNVLQAAKASLYGINDNLNLNSYDPFAPPGARNLTMGKGTAAIVIDFSDASVNSWITARNNCATYFENGVLRVRITGTDPHFPMSIPAGIQFSADEFRYAKISMRNTSGATASQFFFGTNVNPGPAGPDTTSFEISANDAEYKTYIVDMIDDCATPGRWTGIVNTFRWDPLENWDGMNFSGSDVYAEYIAFFKTRAEAEAFDPATFDFSSTALTDGLVGGSTANEWQSAAASSSIVYDLGEAYNISAVSLIPAQNNAVPINSAPNFPLDYTIEFSADMENWFGVITESGKLSETVKSDPQLSVPASATAARYVRVTLTATQPGASGFALSEIVVYGKGGYVDAGLRNFYIPSSLDGWNPIVPTNKYPSGVTPSPANISWTSGDNNVITVDASGFVKAVGLGSTTLTAYDNLYEITATWTVNVLEGQDKTGIADQILISAFMPPHQINDFQFQAMADLGVNLIENIHSGGWRSRQENLMAAELSAKYGMWLLVNEMNTYHDLMLSRGVRADVTYMYELFMTQEELEDYVSFWKDVPGVGGFLLMDEPSTSANEAWNMNNFGTLVSKMKPLTGSDLLLHVSDAPGRSVSQIQGFINNSMSTGYKPDHIGDCEYPFQGTSALTSHPKNTWVNYLDKYRLLGLQYGIPTSRYLQMCTVPGNNNYSRVPGESQLRFQLYSGLAYGVKKFSMFAYRKPDPSWGGSVVDNDGNLLPLYDIAQPLFWQVRALSDIIFPLEARNVYGTSGARSALGTTGLTLLPNTFYAQPGSASDIVIYSQMVNPADGTEYLMVVNGETRDNQQTATGGMTHTINFTNAEGLRIAALTEVSNETGEYMESIDLTQTHSVSIDLLKGEGRLFRIDYAQGISGTITDAETEETLEGATVTLYGANGDEIDAVATDENGNYAFAGVVSGSYTITAAMPGYKSGSLNAKVIADDLYGRDIALLHDYLATYTDPECEADGYWTYACLVCDDEYGEADEGSALGHDMVLASFGLEGKLYECTRCDHFELIPLTDAEYLQEIAEDAFIDGLEESIVQDGETVKLVFDGREIILSENENNVNISGEVYLGDGYWLIYDIKGNGSNIKVFEIVKIDEE